MLRLLYCIQRADNIPPIWKAEDGVPYNKLKLLSFAEEGCTYDTCVVAELGDDDIGILF